ARPVGRVSPDSSQSPRSRPGRCPAAAVWLLAAASLGACQGIVSGGASGSGSATGGPSAVGSGGSGTGVTGAAGTGGPIATGAAGSGTTGAPACVAGAAMPAPTAVRIRRLTRFEIQNTVTDLLGVAAGPLASGLEPDSQALGYSTGDQR